MLKRFLPLAALAALLSACGSGGSTAPVQTPAQSAIVITSDTQSRIDDLITGQMTHQQVPGVSVVVSANGVPILEKGYGLANRETGVSANAQTIYRIGSVTKQFTAAGVMLLIQDGKLTLDQRIAQYFPTAPANWKDITIRQLLQHTSGMQRDFQAPLASIYDPNHNYTPDEIISLFGRIPMASAPGQMYSYSNTGYYVLGLLIERVSGLSYFDFLQNRIFKPLDMSTASLISTLPAPGALAAGYELDDGKLTRADTLFPGDDGGQGGLQMSAPDLAKWDAALYTGHILSQSSREQLWTPTVLNDGNTEQYGLGWVLDSVNGHPFVWHNGKESGYRSQFERHTAEGLTVIVLCNLGDCGPEKIAAGVVALINPALDWKIVADPQPQIGALARGALEDVAAGTLNPQRYTAEEAARLADGVFAAYVAGAGAFGAIEQFGFVDSRLVSGVLTYRYLIKSHKDSALLYLQVDASGKISTLYFG